MPHFLEAISESTKLQIASATYQVKDCFPFDLIAVTGNSGSISRRLLEATGIPTSAFVHIDRETNFQLYPARSHSIEKSRRVNVPEQLTRIGIELKNPPRLLVVDEVIHTGLKAVSYVRELTKLGLSDLKFAAITVRPKNLITDLLKETLIDPSKIFTPSYESIEEQEQALRIMDILTQIHLSTMPPLSPYEPTYDETTIEENRQLVEKILSDLTETIQKRKTN